MTKKVALPLCEIFLYLLFYFLPRHKGESGLVTHLFQRTAPHHSFLDGKTAIGENTALGRASAREAARAVPLFL